MLIAVTLAGCTPAPSTQGPLQITSLTQGLMRKESGEWRVYQPGNAFAFHENGECTAAGKKHTCMWFGFQFDFVAPTDDTALGCVAHFNSPVNLFTAKVEQAEAAKELRFRLPLPGRAGHLSNPGYVIRTNDKPTEYRTQIECSYAGAIVLHYEMTIHGV